MFNYYSNNDPEVDELVLVNFTEKLDGFFKAKLLEYDYQGIIVFQNITKKKKVVSWNKFIQLNKNMVAKIDDVDIDNKIVKLSLIYLKENNDNNLSVEQIQKKLMTYFIENKQLENFIKSFCIINNFNFIDIWTNIIYKIDIQRKIDNYKKSIWSYINDNIDNLENIINNNKIYNLILDYYKKKIENVYKITTKFAIISTKCLTDLKIIFKSILDTFDNKINLKYESTPYYILSSMSNDSTQDDHNLFINKLNDNINIYNKENNNNNKIILSIT